MKNIKVKSIVVCIDMNIIVFFKNIMEWCSKGEMQIINCDIKQKEIKFIIEVCIIYRKDMYIYIDKICIYIGVFFSCLENYIN